MKKVAIEQKQTDANTLEMMRSVVVWIENRTYQGDTDREYPAIQIYDLDGQVIAVFKKSTKTLVTTCELTDKEDKELLLTGNFGGGKD